MSNSPSGGDGGRNRPLPGDKGNIYVRRSGGEGVIDSRDICAVVVTYNPAASIAVNIRALLPQVGKIIVVDNGTGSSFRQRIDDLRGIERVQVICNTENVGIASALNAGARNAIREGYAWIATFDQDSLAPADFIGSLLAAYASCPFRNRVALVSPVYLDQGSGLTTSFAKYKTVAGGFGEVEVTLTSGNLVNVRILAELNYFEESFFIDYVDVEYCLRCVAAGYALIEAPGAVLHHQVGDPTWHRIFGKRFGVTHHDPLRRYYIARNRVAVYRRYSRRRPAWVLRDTGSFARELVKIVLFEKLVIRKLVATARGIWHGVLARSGKHA